MRLSKIVILFVLIISFTNIWAARAPRPSLPNAFSLPGNFNCKIRAKGINEFYTAILSETVVTSGNQKTELKHIREEVINWWKIKASSSVPDEGHAIVYETEEEAFDKEYNTLVNRIDSLYLAQYSVPDSLQLKHPERFKCKDTVAYKLFGGLNPLLWTKAENGEVLLTDNIYLLNGKFRVIIYDPSADWYYISPVYRDQRKITLNENGEWETSEWYLCSTAIAKALYFVLCFLIIALVRISIPYFLGLRSHKQIKAIKITGIVTSLPPTLVVIYTCYGSRDSWVFLAIFISFILLVTCIIESFVFTRLLKREKDKLVAETYKYNTIGDKTLFRINGFLISLINNLLTFLTLIPLVAFAIEKPFYNLVMGILF